MTRMQLYAVIGAVLVAALIAGYFLMAAPGSSPTPADAAQPLVTIAPDDHTLGSSSAPVTVVEYAAPSCPVCARFDAEIFPLLKKTYIDTGKIYYVFRVLPLRSADGAAEAIARCLPKENYFDFIEVLFRKQAEWDPEFGIDDVHTALVKIAHAAGLSATDVDRCIQDKAVQDKINKVAEDGVKQYKLHATPTFIVDGVLQQPGAIPWADLQKTIDAALKKH